MKKKKEKNIFKIIKISNIVQYDSMGYCLRLCLVETGASHLEQLWVDSADLEGDVECIWIDPRK